MSEAERAEQKAERQKRQKRQKRQRGGITQRPAYHIQYVVVLTLLYSTLPRSTSFYYFITYLYLHYITYYSTY